MNQKQISLAESIIDAPCCALDSPRPQVILVYILDALEPGAVDKWKLTTFTLKLKHTRSS